MEMSYFITTNAGVEKPFRVDKFTDSAFEANFPFMWVVVEYDKNGRPSVIAKFIDQEDADLLCEMKNAIWKHKEKGK